MIKKQHIIISFKSTIFLCLLIKVVFIKIQDRINSINIRQISARFTVTVDCFHFFIQILNQHTVIIDLLKVCWIFLFQNISDKIFFNIQICSPRTYLDFAFVFLIFTFPRLFPFRFVAIPVRRSPIS